MSAQSADEITVQEAASLLGVGDNAIGRMVDAKQLDARKGKTGDDRERRTRLGSSPAHVDAFRAEPQCGAPLARCGARIAELSATIDTEPRSWGEEQTDARVARDPRRVYREQIVRSERLSTTLVAQPATPPVVLAEKPVRAQAEEFPPRVMLVDGAQACPGIR